MATQQKVSSDEIIESVVKAIFWVISRFLRWLWRYPLEVCFLALLVFVVLKNVFVGLALCVVLGVALAYPVTRYYLLWDVRRAKRRAGRVVANRFLIEDRLVPELDNKRLYKAWIEKRAGNAVLVTNINVLPGITQEKLENYCEAFKAKFEACLISAETHQDGHTEITFWRSDPLDKPLEVTDIDQCLMDFGKWTFWPCINTAGSYQPITFKNVSGLLVGGQAGSGKSASMLAGLVPYVVKGHQANKVELFGVVDGKSSADWLFLSGLSRHGVIIETESEIQFLTDVRDMFVSLTNEMKSRYEQMRKTGTQNYWDSPECNHLIVIADECQTMFETPVTKEAKALVAEITGLVSSLLKRGRAVAITLVLMTQKCDGNTVPTKIRDMCAVRIGFRVANRTNSAMIFGELRDGGFYPHEIGRNPGIAVIENDRGQPKRVRFGYATTDTLRRWVANV